MKLCGLAISAVVFTAAFAPASAQNSLSTEAPQTPVKARAVHKPKPVSHTRKPDVSLSDIEKAPPPKTVPMDFSGMAKRPVDLPSEYSHGKSSDSDQPKPSLNQNSNGGFSPGMNMKF